MAWLAARRLEEGWRDGPGSPFRFMVEKDVPNTLKRTTAEGGGDEDITDLDPLEMLVWSYEELGRAVRSGLLARLTPDFWDDLAAQEEAAEALE